MKIQMIKQPLQGLRKIRDEFVKWEWLELGLTAVLLLVSFLVFYYTDYSDTLDNAVLLAEAVVKGQFTEFYGYSAVNASPQTTYTADYPLLMYLIFLVWNLPTVIAHLTTGFDYMGSMTALLWCKALIGLALLAVYGVLRKLIGLYRSEKKIQNLAGVLFLTGSCTVLPSMVMVQYDVFAIFFMLLGIYYYLKEDEKKFLLFFAIALPLKTFAVFIFLPLLLLREKRVIGIGLKTLLVFVLQFVGELPFLGDPYYGICMDSQNGDAMKLLLESTVRVAEYELNLFLVCFLMVCVFCYLYRPEKESRERTRYVALYACLASMASLLLLIDTRAYWIILLVPFLLLVLFFDRERNKANLLLFLVSTTAYSVYSFMDFWAYSYRELVSRLFLPKVVSLPAWETMKYGNVQGFFAYHGLDLYANMLYSVFFVGIVLILIINFPGKQAARRWEEDGVAHGKNSWESRWWAGFVQIGISFGLICLLLYVNLAESGAWLNRSLDEETVYGADIMQGNVLSQEFLVAEDAKAELLTFRTYHTNGRRYNRGAARITLEDAVSGQVLTEELVGIALVESDQEYDLKIDEVELKAGHPYRVRIEGLPGKQGQETEFCFAQTVRLLDEERPLLVNGKPQQGNLAIRIR